MISYWDIFSFSFHSSRLWYYLCFIIYIFCMLALNYMIYQYLCSITLCSIFLVIIKIVVTKLLILPLLHFSCIWHTLQNRTVNGNLLLQKIYLTINVCWIYTFINTIWFMWSTVKHIAANLSLHLISPKSIQLGNFLLSLFNPEI